MKIEQNGNQVGSVNRAKWETRWEVKIEQNGKPGGVGGGAPGAREDPVWEPR